MIWLAPLDAALKPLPQRPHKLARRTGREPKDQLPPVQVMKWSRHLDDAGAAVEVNFLQFDLLQQAAGFALLIGREDLEKRPPTLKNLAAHHCFKR